MQMDAEFQDIGSGRGDAEGIDANGRRWLQPDSLPDARGAVVVDAVRDASARLLSARLTGVLAVLDADADPVLAVAEEGGDVEEEGHVAPPVVPHLPAVHPDVRAVIDRPEMEKQV